MFAAGELLLSLNSQPSTLNFFALQNPTFVRVERRSGFRQYQRQAGILATLALFHRESAKELL
jgi:hypothetical protein